MAVEELSVDSVPHPDVVAPEAALPRRHVGAQAALLGLSALAGAGIGLAIAPTTHYDTAGIDVSVDTHWGSSTNQLDIPNVGDVTFPTKIRAGYQSVGVTISVDGARASILDDNGKFDTQKLQTYSTMYSDLDDDVAQIKQQVLLNDGSWAAGGATSLVSLELLGMRLRRRYNERLASLSPDNQQVIREQMRPYQHVIKVGTATVGFSLIAAGNAYLFAPRPVVPLRADPILADTPFAGGQIDGLLAEPIADKLVPAAKQYLAEYNSFYQAVDTNLTKAFEKSVGSLPTDNDSIYVLHTTDTHCNIKMHRIFGTAARLFAADIFIDNGDATLNGGDISQQCVDNEAYRVRQQNKAIKMVFVKGNHDDAKTIAQAKKDRMIVLSGQPIKVDGLTLLGDKDPRYTGFMQTTRLVGDENLESFGERLRNTACKLDKGVDIEVVHSPVAALPTAEAGCARLTVSGDTHRLSGPNPYPQPDGRISYQFTDGTSGGVKPNNLTVGVTLKAPAIMTVFRYSKAEHRPLGYYVITANPDTSVTISDYQVLPAMSDSSKPPLLADAAPHKTKN